MFAGAFRPLLIRLPMPQGATSSRQIAVLCGSFSDSAVATTTPGDFSSRLSDLFSSYFTDSDAFNSPSRLLNRMRTRESFDNNASNRRVRSGTLSARTTPGTGANSPRAPHHRSSQIIRERVTIRVIANNPLHRVPADRHACNRLLNPDG